MSLGGRKAQIRWRELAVRSLASGNEVEQAYRRVKLALGYDVRMQSRANAVYWRGRADRALRDSSSAREIQRRAFALHFRKQLRSTSFALSHGSRLWGQIGELRSWARIGESESVLEKLRRFKGPRDPKSNTRLADLSHLGNYDFVFFYFGTRRQLAGTGSARYGGVKLFHVGNLYRSGWITLGDWIDPKNRNKRHLFYGADILPGLADLTVARALESEPTREGLQEEIDRLLDRDPQGAVESLIERICPKIEAKIPCRLRLDQELRT